MKKVYILQQNGFILIVSANRKTVYDCLREGLSDFNRCGLVSYSQYTRHLKRTGFFFFTSGMGSRFEVSQNKIFPSFKKFKASEVV